MKSREVKHDLVWWYDKIGLTVAVAGLCLAILGFGDHITTLLIGAVPVALIGALMVVDTFVHEKGLVH